MSQQLLFARHGNTFGPGDKVVWVGRETDLPLVDKGLEQAAAAADALKRKGLIPDAIYCASLQRTRRFATIVARGSVSGVQFHPEKSSLHGLQMLRNFVRTCHRPQNCHVDVGAGSGRADSDRARAIRLRA